MRISRNKRHEKFEGLDSHPIRKNIFKCEADGLMNEKVTNHFEMISQKMSIIFFVVVVLFSSGFSSLKAEDEKIFSSGDHCLAYRTPKKMFFFTDVIVIGKSCQINAWTATKGTKKRFIVTVPVESLDSDNSRRDGVVMEILKAEDHPYLRFETDWFADSVIRNLLQTGNGNVKGILSFADRSYPVSFQMNFFNEGGHYGIEGHLVTNYTAFEMEPPVGGPGGFMAIVKDKLELLAHLQSDQITGF